MIRSPIIENSLNLSCGSKSVGGMGLTLASKINMALSRVVSNNTNGILEDQEDM